MDSSERKARFDIREQMLIPASPYKYLSSPLRFIRQWHRNFFLARVCRSVWAPKASPTSHSVLHLGIHWPMAFTNSRRNYTKNHLDAFFAQYPDFPSYDPFAPATKEFYRMCDFFEWERDDDEKQEAKQLFQNALTKEFNDIYGTDANSLASWQTLCRILEISPVPEKLKECRAAVKQTHVNIVDLVDTQRTCDQVKVFPSELALSTYTKNTGKYFPKENAYAGGLLRYLLRQIINPDLSDRESGTRRGKGRGNGNARGGGRGRRGTGRRRGSQV